MNGKKLKITVLTLALILLCANAVFAWNMTCSSYIGNGIITIGGYSTTGTDIVCDTVEVISEFYRDGVRVDYQHQTNNNATWAQADVAASNPLGIQSWNLYGTHRSEDGSVIDRNSSYYHRDH